MKIFKQNGDTIIEVLFVLAILGFAITTSYESASRSLSDTEQANQNTYATELAQSQVEEIRTLVNNSTVDIIGSGNLSGLNTLGITQSGTVFCMYNGQASLPASYCQTKNGIEYNAEDTLLAPLQANGNLFNDTAIPYIYTFEVQEVWPWPTVAGQGVNTVTLYYQVYPPPAPSS